MPLDPRSYNPVFSLGGDLGTANMTYPEVTGATGPTGATGATGVTGPTGPAA